MEFDELMKIETDDTDPETLFIELPESCEEEEIFEDKVHTSNHVSFQEVVKEEKSKVIIDEQSCSTSNSNSWRVDHKRDEDVIFGELVTSMLSKMEDDEKRKMKKAIMNILL